MTAAALIDIDRATVYRGDNAVLRNFSLTIRQGEQVAIVGPNGAGKSTLLKLVNRELYPAYEEGREAVRILGKHTWNVWELRKQIGLVSDDLRERYPIQATALDVALSGFFSSIGTHGLLREDITTEHIDRAKQTLAAFGAAEFATVPLSRMSTGERRRCLLARAMVHKPGTLVLDEPMAGLDVAARFDYLARIRTMIGAGTNIVLVTHHLNEIPPEVERVILLRNGRIVADGSKSAVLTESALTETFGVSVRLRSVDGYYFVYPA